MRACGVYRAAGLFYSGERYKEAQKFVTDPGKHWRHIPMRHCEDLHIVVPYDCVPVAVDIIDGAIPLQEYKHPERAFYVFGPEDGTLGKKTLEWCRDVVYVPTDGCMNLAASVNVVLYDRLAKQLIKKGTTGR